MGSIKRLVLFFVGMLMLSGLLACSDTDIKSLNGSEVVVGGQSVELREATPATDAMPENDNQNTLPSNSIRPPITKYLITSKDGVAYLTDFYSYGDTLKIEEYWTKENGYWVFHKETKEFPLNIGIEGYPQSPEYGYLLPSDPKYYLIMSDGVVYATRNEIIPITSETIRISEYYVRETPEGRWYYYEGYIDLPKKDAKIEQVKM